MVTLSDIRRVMGAFSLFSLCLLVRLPALAAVQCDELKKPPFDILKRQGFGGVFDAGSKMCAIGDIRVGSKRYNIYYYSHEEQRPIGKFPHGQQRIVIVEGGKIYSGSYVVDDDPKAVTGTSILFNVPENIGNRIFIGPNGPPKHAWIDGEIILLEK